MTDNYNYRPKFTDIRIRKPMSISAAKEEPKPCEAEGCTAEGKCRAPKSPHTPNEFWWFCQKHAAEYNKNWDFFAGMTAAEYAAFQTAEKHGHRPTWNFGAKGGSRESATFRQKEKPGQTFQSRAGRTRRVPASEVPSTASQPVVRALEDLGLDLKATAKEVRQTYAELVRRFHPDSNGGDRSAEARLAIVVKAYKVLKTAKRA